MHYAIFVTLQASAHNLYRSLFMEDIKSNIINGNWQDAVRICKNSNSSFPDILQSIIDDESMGIKDAMRLLKLAMHFGYIQEHSDYER